MGFELISVSDSDGRGNCEEELAIISIIKDVSYMRYYFTVTKLFLFYDSGALYTNLF